MNNYTDFFQCNSNFSIGPAKCILIAHDIITFQPNPDLQGIIAKPGLVVFIGMTINKTTSFK